MALVKLDRSCGDLMTIEEWEEGCECSMFIDYDGYGQFCNPETNLMEDDVDVYASDRDTLSYKAQRVQWTHILWFNR
jgi:hypothetical protein